MKRTNLFTIFSVLYFIFYAVLIHAQSNSAFSSDGVEIHFEQRGTGETALVFIHGWSNSKSIWDLQMDYFSNNYTTVAVDLAGFGESGNNRTNWTIEACAEDVIAVINKLNLSPVVLVGFSMGTFVAAEISNKIPDKINGVVLVEGMHNIDNKITPQTAVYIDSVFLDLVENPDNEKLIQKGFYKNNPEESYQRILFMLKDNSKTGWRETLNNSFKWINEQQVESLKKIKQPLTIINTDINPTNTDALKKHVPSAELRIIPGAGHVVMWDKPDEFNLVLDEVIMGYIN